MSSLRLPRWTALLVLPLLAGALLLMHGLEATASAGPAHATSAETPSDTHGSDAPVDQETGHCTMCVGHLVVACVAVLATVIGLGLVPRPLGRRRRSMVDGASGLVRAIVRLARAPVPVWVRLEVMHC